MFSVLHTRIAFVLGTVAALLVACAEAPRTYPQNIAEISTFLCTRWIDVNENEVRDRHGHLFHLRPSNATQGDLQTLSEAAKALEVLDSLQVIECQQARNEQKSCERGNYLRARFNYVQRIRLIATTIHAHQAKTMDYEYRRGESVVSAYEIIRLLANLDNLGEMRRIEHC